MMKKVITFDLETPKACFLASFYNPQDDSWHDFLINQFQNDLYKMLKYLEDNKDYFFVGYNSLKFDMQVIEYILRTYHEWGELSGLEIAKKIAYFATEEIDRSNYGLFSSYMESEFHYKTIDTPAIWHFFNENKRVSLKQLEFEMRAETIENMELDLKAEEFTQEQIDEMIHYCHNDVLYTYQHYLFTIGETEHPLYKGKDKIKDRQIILDEVGLNCMNWDDVKIGAEWNKKDFMEMTGKLEKELKPAKVNSFYGKRYSTFFPSSVTFQTQKMKDFIEKIGNTHILSDKQEFKFEFNKDLTVTVARGGLHSCEKGRILQPTEDEMLLQNDIGSQYPNFLKKANIYPKHLGSQWNSMLVGKIERRISYKKLYGETKEPKYNSLQEMGKLALNGGAYGRLNTQGDWQQDPCAMLKVTMGCQLEILMIVEALVLKGFKVTSCNTDGWDCIIPKNRFDEYIDTVLYYEEKIGNKDLGKVEFTEFEWMAQLSVNDYIAKKKGEWINKNFRPHKSVQAMDEYKTKGDFTCDFELHKNSSFRIIPLALREYFVNGTDPEEFINKHQDIFDFCARSNSGQTYIHYGYKGNQSFVLPKLIRYFVSKDGIKVKKIVKDDVDTGANDQNLRPAEHLKTVCNKLSPQDHKVHLASVERKWYIQTVREKIFLVTHGRKPNLGYKNENQITLF